MKRALLTMLILFCSGCATNPFHQFYQDRTGGIDITTAPNIILSTGEPKIYSGSNLEADKQKMLEDGYSLLGFSSFNAGNVGKRQLVKQAKKVKAEVVVFYSQYTNTISGSMPLTLPDTTTVTTNHSGTGFNSGNIHGYGGFASYSGSGSYYGSSTSTIYGLKTTYIPYSQNRYDYFASFWIKMKRPIFGVFMDDLPSELREKIGSNKGALVIAVINGSPAFMSDVLKGDIVRKIDDTEIIDAKILHELLPKFAGQVVTVELIRDGKNITKQIKLNKPE